MIYRSVIQLMATIDVCEGSDLLKVKSTPLHCNSSVTEQVLREVRFGQRRKMLFHGHWSTDLLPSEVSNDERPGFK